MIYSHLFEQNGNTQICAGLIGTGAYGTPLLAQSQVIPRLKVPVICEQDLKVAQQACQQAGIPDEKIAICENRQAVLQAIEDQKWAIVQDSMLLMDTPVDVIVECTGDPEAGARHAVLAIQHGKHVAMVTKETDSVIGPILSHRAKQAGLVYTPVDGDQHGLLIGFVFWLRSLGLEVICGGKAHDGELIYDDKTGKVSHRSTTITLTQQESSVLREILSGEAKQLVEDRRETFKNLVRLSEADLCESVIAANATGLMPDVPSLHGPIVRISEIPTALCPQEAGGLLSGPGAIDAVICLRRSDEAGLAGGIFVVFACRNESAWSFLKKKGIITSRQGDYGLLYRPYHLLGVETPISLLCAGLLNLPTGGNLVEPQVDLVARSTSALTAGTIIHGVDKGLEPLIVPSISVESNNPLPYHMIVGNQIKVDVPAGTILTYDMIEPPSKSQLWALRYEQDQKFQYT